MLPVYTNIRKLQLVSCQLSIIIIKMLNNDTRHTTSILLIRICCGVIRTVSVLESLVWCGQWTTIVGLIFVCRVSLLRTVITICKHFEIFVHPLLRKLRILWPVLLLVHDSITVTLCSTKCLTKTSTNCSEFRIVQHELSVESVDGNKMLGSYVTSCTGYLFTLGRILNWQLCVLNHTSCDNQIIWQ